MKKIFNFFAMFLILTVVQVVLAENSTPTPDASFTPQPAATSTRHHKHKASPTATAQATPIATGTVQAASAANVMIRKAVNMPAAKATATPAPLSRIAITSVKVYDRINMPGDFRRALSLAVQTLNPASSKANHTVFLALDKVSSNKDDKQRKNAYVRFNVDQVEWVGPKNAWIVLAGTVYEQQGGDCKMGDPIELAVDFKDIKIDYDGTKLGSIQKGNDIAEQVYEKLESHSAYQFILAAQDQVKDSKYQDDTAAYIAKAREGYSILDSLNSAHESSR